jgi:hypothetical protein
MQKTIEAKKSNDDGKERADNDETDSNAGALTKWEETKKQ